MAQSVFIEHATPDGWQAASEQFLLYCYNQTWNANHRGFTKANLNTSPLTIAHSNSSQLPDHQWSKMYPAFTKWIAETDVASAWVEHGRLWISDDTSVHLRRMLQNITNGHQQMTAVLTDFTKPSPCNYERESVSCQCQPLCIWLKRRQTRAG